MTLPNVNGIDDPPWWRLPVSTWFFLAGLALLSATCCLRPMLVDVIAAGLVRLADFRFWPWWFFLELAIALAFSVRWFLLLSDRDRDTWTESRRKEANAFFDLTGSICLVMFLLAALDRFGLLRPAYDSLFHRFGSGEFLVETLFTSVGFILLPGFLIVLALNWISTLISRN